MDSQPRDRSLFWPIVLIGVGVVWLLANFNLIAGLDWVMLLRLWPLLLVAAGLELLFGRGRPWVSALVGLLTVGAAIFFLLYGQQLGLARSPQVTTERFTVPLEGATSARVSLDLAQFHTDVSGTAAEGELLDATLAYTGRIVIEESGGAQRTVSLRHEGEPAGLFDFFETVEARWTIGLSPAVPLDLHVDIGSGSADLDLAALRLEALAIEGGSGSLDLALPPGGAYTVRLNGGSGSSQVSVPPGVSATLNYDGGSGSLSVDVPDGLAARVEVRDSGSGSVSLPRGWETVSDGDDDDEGVWQTAGFDAAAQQFTLIVDDLGSGSVSVR